MSRPVPRPARSVTFGALVLLLIHSFAETAPAATLFWLNATSGSAATAAHWAPAQVPTEADVLRYDVGGTYTVTFPASVDSVNTHQVFGGDVTFDCTVPHGVRTDFQVESMGGPAPTARVLSGTLRMGWSASIGTVSFSEATLRVSGAGTNVGQNAVGATAGFPLLAVGGGGGISKGIGDLIIRNGGQVAPALRTNIGSVPASVGTLSVRGEGIFNSQRRRSAFLADNPGSDVYAGRDGGLGIIEVLDGGLVRLDRELLLALQLSDSAEVTVGGAGVIDSSRIRVKDDLRMCVNPTPMWGGRGGGATIDLDSLGVLVVEGSTVVGDPDGSYALITLHPHSRMITKHLILQQAGAASMDLQGGLLQVNGGTLSTSTGRLEFPGVYGYDDPPVVELLNGASATFTGSTSNPPLAIGTTGYAELRVTGGAQVVANGGTPTVAEGSRTATLSLSEGGHFSSDRRILLGVNALGQLNLESGASLTADGIDMGPNFGGVGTLDVEDGAIVTLTGSLNVAGGPTTSGFGGLVTIDDGGQVDVTAPLLAGTIWPTGHVGVGTGGRLDLDGVMTVRGDLTPSGGSVLGGALALRGDGRINGSGNIMSTILGGIDTTVTIVAGGSLQIGNEVAGGGVLMRGTIDVGANSITISDPDSAVLGTVLLAGGGIYLPPGGAVIEAGRRLIGEGTVLGPLTPRGYVIATGTGLRFAGTVHGTGQGMNGTAFQFLAGSVFEGGGLLRGAVTADAGSIIRATAPLVLGYYTVPSLLLKGRVESGAGLSLVSFNITTLAGELVLGGPVLSVAPLNVTTGKITGAGLISGNVILGGTIAPGASPGRVEVMGDVSFDIGTYAADLGNHAAGEADTLDVYGTAALGSGTLALHRLPSFVAAGGDSFRVLSYGTRIGTFSQVTLDGTPLTTDMTVHYNSDGVWVIVNGNVGVGDPPAAAGAIGPLRLAALGSPGRGPAVELSLPDASHVAVQVFDLQGREVAELWSGALAVGRHHFDLARSLPGSGIYFARARITSGSGTTERVVRVVKVQ